MDRVLASEARGCWFDPSRAHHCQQRLGWRVEARCREARGLRVNQMKCSSAGAEMNVPRAGMAQWATGQTPHLELGSQASRVFALLLAAWVCLGALGLSGCSSVPSAGRGPDGPPPAGAAPDPMTVPDAEPRVEPIREGGPNKPYEVLGQSYTPVTADEPLVERGLASWYGRKFHGRRTASGETYNMYAMSAAHKTMPVPSYARITNPANGQEVIVRVNDRGPFTHDRVIDLSWAAAMKLGVQGGGKLVEVRRLTNEEIRAGVKPAASATTANAVTVAPSATAAPAASMTARAPTEAAAGFWLQLGAFSRSAGALDFQRKVADELDWLSPLLTVFAEGGVHRLQAGPYRSREQAREAAERVRAALSLVPVVLERR
jgi:rare lipoprotein A